MFESNQARVTGIAVLLSLMITVIAAAQSLSAYGMLAMLIFSIPAALLLIFEINCMVMGSCHIYAWIRTVVFVIVLIGSMSAFTFLNEVATKMNEVLRHPPIVFQEEKEKQN
jgi:flagellar motor component MotA